MSRFLIIAAAVVALSAGLWLRQATTVDFYDLDENGYKWRDMEGQWVMVNYFAEWCAPCLKEIPELNAFDQTSNDDIHLFGMSFDPLTADQLREVRAKYNIQFTLLDPASILTNHERPKALPATVVIGPDGVVRKVLMGEQTSESLAMAMAQLKSLES